MNAPKQEQPTNAGNVATALSNALHAAAKGNSHTATAAAAVLWPDKEQQWLCALPTLQKLMPNLCVLGDYDPGLRRGPAIWLKCAIAGLVPEVDVTEVPIVYLPGVSRSELRAIESCPRDLQPLAELQYRGVFWSQLNGKDWTLAAFLSSKNGGLGLDVAQDKATQEALMQALQAGVLLSCNLNDLQQRSISSEWLLTLIAPNPNRDLLAWMNAPDVTVQQWGAVLWSVFTKRCQSDFGFDPVADGVLAAAERLAQADGKWAAVSVLYHDSFGSFPHVFDLLAKLQPPQLGLFPKPDQLSGYPQANEQGESALRYALSACAAMNASQARAAVLAAEKEHGIRRNWIWARMGQSALATALAPLAEVAQRSASVPIGQTSVELAHNYLQTGWQVDDAALRALAAVQTKADLDVVGGALRAIYLPWLEETAYRLQQATKTTGGLQPLTTAVTGTLTDGTCIVFVDGLRYDVANQLQARLTSLGTTHLTAQWSSLPSVTASGKAWCSPVAHLITGTPEDIEFEPRVAADGKPLSGHNFRKLLKEQGIQPLDKHETGSPQGRAWTQAGDLDHYGHEHGIRLARDMDMQLNQVVERIAELCAAGWKRIRIVTDHGWLLIPGGLPKSELAKYQTETRWGRCAVLKGNANETALTFGWDWCKDIQVAYAPGVTSFIAGAEYAHGGISLQECLTPVVQLDCTATTNASATVTIQSITWRGLRCTVQIEGASTGQQIDIRTKALLASSSLAASPKLLDTAGKASLAVVDDDQVGAAAVVLVLNANGEVVQKQSTTVGEQ